MTLQTLTAVKLVLAGTKRDLLPGETFELEDEKAVKLLRHLPGKVRPVVHAGDWIEWLSPALPRQRAEVLAVYEDGTCEAFHPLTETLCRLPLGWIVRYGATRS